VCWLPACADVMIPGNNSSDVSLGDSTLSPRSGATFPASRCAEWALQISQAGYHLEATPFHKALDRPDPGTDLAGVPGSTAGVACSPGRAKPPRNWEPDRRTVVMAASGHRAVMCGRAGRCHPGRAVERSSARPRRTRDSVLLSDCPRPRWRALAFTGGMNMSRSIPLLPRGPDHPPGTIPVCFASSAARSVGTAW